MIVHTTLLVTCSLLAASGKSDVSKEVEKAVRMQEAAFQKKDITYIRQHTTANHVSVTPYLQCYSQANLLKAVPNFKITSHTIKDVRVIPVTKDVVVVSYRFEFTGTFQGKRFPTRVQVLATWVKRDANWIEASYQQTVMGPPKN